MRGGSTAGEWVEAQEFERNHMLFVVRQLFVGRWVTENEYPFLLANERRTIPSIVRPSFRKGSGHVSISHSGWKNRKLDFGKGSPSEQGIFLRNLVTVNRLVQKTTPRRHAQYKCRGSFPTNQCLWPRMTNGRRKYSTWVESLVNPLWSAARLTTPARRPLPMVRFFIIYF